jgi:hypothetical protein
MEVLVEQQHDYAIWEPGKYHFPRCFFNGITFNQSENILQEGCYGTPISVLNLEEQDNNIDQMISVVQNDKIQAVDCRRLFEHSIRMANEKFIPFCEV